MSRLVLLIALFALTGCDGPHAEGRAGNAAYRADAFDQARQHYADALAQLDTTASRLRADLLFNTAQAHAADGSHQQAVALYDSSRSATPQQDAGRRVDAAYNGGLAAYDASDLPGSAARFRRALVIDPDDAQARHNWEYVARQMEQDRQQGGQNPPPEPSDFARRLKEQADALVAQQRYGAAYALMQDGLARDETVAAFNTFIARTGAVAQIDAPTATPR